MKKILSFIIIGFLSLFFTSCKEEVFYTLTLDYQNEMGVVTTQTKGDIELSIPIKDGYKFLGWFTEDNVLFEEETIKENTILKANWLKLGERFNIYYDPKGGKMPEDTPYKYETGIVLELPIPTKDHHDFLGWYLDDEYIGDALFELPDNISGAKTLYAKWVDVAVYKNVTYETKGGVLPDNSINKYIPGNIYELVACEKEGYFFRGWYDNKLYKGKVYHTIDEKQNADLTFYAKWEEEKLENTFISIYGDSVSTFEGWLPEGYASYYPINPVNVLTVEETWWYSAISKVNARYHSNASYSNTGVVTTGSPEALKGTEITRIKTLRKDNQNPDVIIIYLGINDCKRSIRAKSFKEGYITMIERMKEEFSGTKIMICTLNACSFSVKECYNLRLEYNIVIREVATQYNLPVIELDKVITEENKAMYMANMLHPNRAGMDEISKEVVRVLKENYK